MPSWSFCFYVHVARPCIIPDGLLCYRTDEYTRCSLSVIHDNHDLEIAGHPGYGKTYGKIARTFYGQICRRISENMLMSTARSQADSQSEATVKLYKSYYYPRHDVRQVGSHRDQDADRYILTATSVTGMHTFKYLNSGIEVSYKKDESEATILHAVCIPWESLLNKLLKDNSSTA
jgi:hypothetical protein